MTEGQIGGQDAGAEPATSTITLEQGVAPFVGRTAGI